MYKREDFKGNNSLDTIIIRLDFLSIDQDNIGKIVQAISQILGDEYKYSNIDNYNINLKISDPKKLITQDFIEQKTDYKNNFEFKNDENGVRFVINNNFFLYERKKFENYEGSQSDTETYLKLLIEFFKYNVQVQRLGVRKINCFYTKNKISCLKKIVKDKFMSEIDNEMNPKYSIVYTPLEKNDKNGYNLGMKLDYGVLEKNEKKQDVYRYILDIDSYIRNVEQIDKLEKITEKITELKTKDFEIYISRLQNKFLETMVIRDNKEKFNEEIEKYGIIHGVNYGK